jgi:hypothetical protein
MSLAPSPSLTRTATRKSPAASYRWVTIGPLASPNTPSPSRSQSNESVSPGSASVDPEASSLTGSGVGPFAGTAVTAASGGLLPANQRTRQTLPPPMST